MIFGLCYFLLSTRQFSKNIICDITVLIFMSLTLFFYFWTAIINPGIQSTMDPNATDNKEYCIACRVKRENKIIHWYYYIISVSNVMFVY